MEKVTLNAYLFFDGNSREAMEFYQSIFGGKLDIQTYDEVPGNTDEKMKGKVIHAALTGGEIDLMSSDAVEGERGAGKISLSLSGPDEEKLRTIFNKLSSDVTVAYPLKEEFWGDIFGSFTDKYGIDWMVNITAKKD